MTLPIPTERLLLHRFTPTDVPDILAFVAHPSVARVTPEIGTTEAEVRAYVDRQCALQPFEKDQCFDLGIERRVDGRVIGLLSLVCGDHRQAAIGWGLGFEHRGQGYATEAARALLAYGFSELDLHRIYAKTSSRNPGSYRVMERLGMRREAELREAEFHDGAWIDVLIYGLLAAEWREREAEG
jgi:RimJ/RimL family protein N-acetyltransferase